DTINNTKCTMIQLQKILYHLSLSYDNFHIRLKEACLAYALRLVHLLRREIREDSITGDCLMQAICQIVGIEVYNLPGTMKCDETSQQQQNKDGKVKEVKSEKKKLLNILAWSKGWQENFWKCKVVSKVLGAVGQVLQMPEQFNFAVTLMNLLLVLSQTEFSKSIIHSGVMQHLWMQLLPPVDKFAEQLPQQVTSAPAPDKMSKHWTELNWPRVYKPALEMITVLLQSEKYMFLDDVITFMGIHEEHIISSILGIRYSVDKWPLDLSVTVLTLIRELSQYKDTWRLAHEKSMFTIMRAVMMCLSSCVSYLIHPRILKIMVERPPVASAQHLKAITADDPEISPHLISIQNRLLDIVCLCMATLTPYSPSIVSLLTDFRECDVEWEPLVEVNFTAPALIFSKPSPTISQEALPSLTFGTLIAFANLCTSALGKTSRMPSPGVGRYVSCPLSGGVTIASGLNATWVSTMDKYRITMGLELSLTLIASQGIMHLMDHRLSQLEKQLIKREIGAEMALFLEYAKRNLRYLRDGTESSRSGTDGFSWSRYPGSSFSRPSYPSVLTDDKRSNVVRRLWPGLESKSLHVSKHVDYETLNYSLEGEQASGSKVSETLDTTFGIAGSDSSKKGTEEENKDQELESESAQQSSDYTSTKSRSSRSEGVGSKRSWTSATVSSKTPVEKVPQSTIAVPSEETIKSIPFSQFGNSEDYFRLMAHIFNCIFR
ncbi:hypothetical protein L9F63_019615, partial [Diploptera punctata]